MIKLYRVTFDSLDGYFVVHTPGGLVHFTINEHGMPALDLKENPEAACLLLQMVRSNYEGYTPREVKLARTTREAKAMMASPSDKDMKNAVSSAAIENIPFQKEDISNAKRILGPSLEETRGKTTRTKPEHVKANHVSIPAQVAERLKYMTMSAAIFFVDKIPFLLTMGRGLQFVTAEYTQSRRAPKLAEHLKKVLRVYRRAGYVVRYILMDGEFEKIKPLLPNVVCNTTAAKEHVAKRERGERLPHCRSHTFQNA